MRKHKRGFTITEVSLFLAITGLLFVGITAGMQNTIFQQRYNDSVQSFAEFLRSTYSQVANVENGMKGGGKSDKVIYGKLIVFGEEKNFSGGENNDGAVFSYTVIGKDSTEGSIFDVEATVFDVISKEPGSGEKMVQFVGIVDEFVPKWESRIQTTEVIEEGNYSDFRGSVLIARNPRSGTINTYYNENPLQINEIFEDSDEAEKFVITNEGEDGFKPVNDNLKVNDLTGINFCINPDPNAGRETARRNVRIAVGARNASGVEIIDMDSDQNKCNK